MTTTTGRRLCAHADRGMHYLEPGETCPDSVSVSDPVLTAAAAAERLGCVGGSEQPRQDDDR